MDRMLEATARAEDRHFWFLGLRRNSQQVLTRALGGRRGLALVDCGAGTGRNLDWLSAFGLAIGVELNAAGLGEGRRQGRRMVRGSVAALPFGDASMDVATSFDVLYCLPEPVEHAAVREMYRVLKPGGVAIVNAAALDMLHGSHSALTHELRRYTRPRLRQLLEGAGFEIERMTFTNMVTFPVTLAVRWLDRVRGRAAVASENDLQVPAAPVNAVFDAALRIEHLMMRAVDLPIGTSLLCVARKR
jgi:SAM-dependent methyltransferase